MATLKSYAGINNVAPANELSLEDFASASNIDLDLNGKPGRRAGYASDSATVHKNLWKAKPCTLATRGAAGDLVNVDSGAVLHAGLGHTPRVWYCDLPDGRTIYSNGVTQGVVNAAASAVASWGIPLPNLAGVAAANTAGNLHAGDYQWALTHQRLADGIEGGPSYKSGVVAVTTGGISFTGIPVPAGYRTNVYLTSHNGSERYLAGFTTNGSFSFTGKNKDLVLPCRTDWMNPAPAGKLLGFWRGRALVAVGTALFASRPHSWELYDLVRDFKNFSANITLVQPVDGGIWVGTEKELAFLGGNTWDQLARVVKVTAGAVLGSGCKVPGEWIRVGKGRGQGDAMVCIADGWLVAGFADGSLVPLSQDRYRVSASEVSAAFRLVGNDLPQYIALPQ
jgi:hypothetical protein